MDYKDTPTDIYGEFYDVRPPCCTLDDERVRRKARRRRRRNDWNRRHDKILTYPHVAWTDPDAPMLRLNGESWYDYLARWYGEAEARRRYRRDKSFSRRLTERGRLSRYTNCADREDFVLERERMQRRLRQQRWEEEMELYEHLRLYGDYCGEYCHSTLCNCGERWMYDDYDYDFDWSSQMDDGVVYDEPEPDDFINDDYTPSDFGQGYDAGLCGDPKTPPEGADKQAWLDGYNEGWFDRNYK